MSAEDDPPAGVPALWARRKVEALEDTAYAGANVPSIPFPEIWEMPNPAQPATSVRRFVGRPAR